MNLILGSSAGLSERDLEPFLKTLFETDYSGDVVFFMAEGDHETIRRLESRIQIETFSPRLLQTMSIHGLRYLLYQGFLKKNRDRYEKVMLTDVRDVIFQKDPFDFEMKGLSLFLEEISIGACPFNSHWIEVKFGAEEKARLSPYPVSCSGITMGSVSDVLDYLTQMKKHLVPSLPLIGYDQGVHNYLLHHGMLGSPIQYSNGKGPVMTMQYMKSWNVAEGKILNEDGSIVPVLHQYDRYFSLLLNQPRPISP
jgi:hypothetical protein